MWPQVIDDYLAEECSKERVLGPLKQELFPQMHPHRFGVIPKEGGYLSWTCPFVGGSR